jgi:hypothetical protein
MVSSCLVARSSISADFLDFAVRDECLMITASVDTQRPSRHTVSGDRSSQRLRTTVLRPYTRIPDLADTQIWFYLC